VAASPFLSHPGGHTFVICCCLSLQAIKDWFICLPNGIGAMFNVICLVLCFIFPAKSGSSSSRRRNLTGAIDPSTQFAAVRIQSVRHYPAGNGSSNNMSGSSSGGEGGFFDLTQFRWRNSPGDFFQRLGSRLSFRQNSQGLGVSNSGMTGLEVVMQPSVAAVSGIDLGDNGDGQQRGGGLKALKEVESAEDNTLRGKDNRIPVGVGDVEQGAAAAVHAVSGSAAASAANAASTISTAEGHL
jgi:hypothetical protein